MKLLQAALDLFNIEETFRVLDQVGRYVDIIELGTPLMVAEGARAVKAVKDRYPDKTVFADIKVMDGGGVVPKPVLEAGADMVSVLAAADDNTVRAAIALAREYHAQVLVDMCSVKDIAGRAREIEGMNPDYICVHVGYDIQSTGADPIEELRKLDGIRCKKAIAGGIGLSTFEAAVSSAADTIISGGGIYNQPNMGEVAAKMREILDRYNGKLI
ncbi:MAG: 3-hexulose-6-phosphate synthase [Lachnospiraceae bacterium]|nr:3-hexulose-6-phosphate synthase [Lachnospiraceae bacterium]